MATTGVDLYNLFRQNVDEAYTGYTDTVKANRLFKETYIKIVQDIYNQRLTNQNAYDQLSYLIAIREGRTIAGQNNRIYHAPIPIASISYVAAGPNWTVTVTFEEFHYMVAGDTFTFRNLAGITGLDDLLVTVDIATSTTTVQVTVLAPIVIAGAHTANTGEGEAVNSYYDYLHYLYGEASFNKTLFVNLTGSTNSSPIRITFDSRTDLRDGDQVVIAGITGNTNANGTFFLRQEKERVYSLFTDANLQNPTTGNGTHAGTATVNQLITSPLKFKESDRKGATYGQPTIANPYFQQSKLTFFLLPFGGSEVAIVTATTLDYIRKMPREIDTTNNVIDYERYYPFYFLNKLAVEAGRQFAFSTRDGALGAGMTEELVQNP